MTIDGNGFTVDRMTKPQKEINSTDWQEEWEIKPEIQTTKNEIIFVLTKGQNKKTETFSFKYPDLSFRVKEIVQSLIDASYKRGREETEVCICAAVKDDTGYIWRGHRHGDCMVSALSGHRKPTGEQGFMTSKNRFVGREEGRKLQDKAGIESAAKDDGGYRYNTLFSEDLY